MTRSKLATATPSCSLCLSPKPSGAGVGTALPRTFDEALAARGVEHMLAAVMCGNDEALAFYRKAGFVPAGIYLWRNSH